MRQFLPYGRQSISSNDIKEVVKVLKSDWITTGPKVEEFEKAFSKYIGCKYAVAVNSGTSALDIAVAALEIDKQSEIITTPFTFVATSNAIIYNNLKPVFVDIERDTRNIDTNKIKRKITKRTKAIIYVDYAGQPCDIDELKEIAAQHNLFLIEDACHALGAEYKGIKVGVFADLTVFSFHPVKHITTGEGGMVTTNNEELYKKLRMLRNHGIDRTALERFGAKASWAYDMRLLGRNYRITDFQCALGLSQLKKLEVFINKRQAIAKRFTEAFQNIEEITPPYVKPNVRHVWHLYTILLDEKIDRNKFFTLMRERNLGVNVLYIPIYKFTYYQNHFNFNAEDFPVTEDVFNRIIALPIFPKMSGKDINYVIETTKNSVEKLR